MGIYSIHVNTVLLSLWRQEIKNSLILAALGRHSYIWPVCNIGFIFNYTRLQTTPAPWYYHITAKLQLSSITKTTFTFTLPRLPPQHLLLPLLQTTITPRIKQAIDPVVTTFSQPLFPVRHTHLSSTPGSFQSSLPWMANVCFTISFYSHASYSIIEAAVDLGLTGKEYIWILTTSSIPFGKTTPKKFPVGLMGKWYDFIAR